MPSVIANGTRLYYELHGPADAEVVVLSNGVLMSTASWAFQTPVLSQQYRVLLYDCRGMWQSDHPPGPYSMELHAEDLAGLLDALHIDYAHIAGISYGGEVSLTFALKYPKRTRSLIVSSAVSQVDRLLRGWMESWMVAVEARDAEAFFSVSYPTNFSEAWLTANQPALDLARQRYEALNYDSFRELLLSFSAIDITADLHAIKAPTLVIVGEEDILKPRKYSELIAGEIPGAEFAVVPHAGHAVLWEQPALFNSLILGFLSKHVDRENA